MTTNDKSAPAAAAEAQLTKMLTGAWVTQTLYVAAKLGIADHLRTGAIDCETLAAVVGADPNALRRLLRALVSLGICERDANDCYQTTSLGELLESEAPRSLHALATMMGEEHYRAWGDLLYSVETGETAFEHRFGEPVCDYFATHPDASVTFQRATIQLAEQMPAAVVDAYDFSDFRKVVDIGGGRGTLLAAILQAEPRLEGILFDQPAMRSTAREFLAAQNVADRCQLVVGDFFLSVPEEGDLYLLATVLHDFPADQAIEILRNAHQAMPAGAKLLVIERVLGAPHADHFAVLADLNLLVISGGLERTEDEYRDLLQAAGFRLARTIATRCGFSILEAAKA
jgi:hypothetical protein